MAYTVEQNSCCCHPETYDCADWAIMKNGEKFVALFLLSSAEVICAALNQQETKPADWTRLIDALPQAPGKYLCWEAFYSSSTGSPVLGVFDGERFYTEIAEDYSQVTHWAQLPGPPSEVICPLGKKLCALAPPTTACTDCRYFVSEKTS